MGRKVTSILLLVLIFFALTVGMILAALPDVSGPGGLTITDLNPASETVPQQPIFTKSAGPEGCSFGHY